MRRVKTTLFTSSVPVRKSRSVCAALSGEPAEAALFAGFLTCTLSFTWLSILWRMGICLVMLLPCGVAFAQEAEPKPYPSCDGTSADTAAAKGAFQAGTAAFNEADYDRAITYWEDAYRRDCNAHALLKNLAIAYELNAMFKHAILALRTYIERNPSTGETEALERRISNLQLKLEEAKAAPEPAAPTAPAAQATDEPEQANASDDFWGTEEEKEPGGQRSIIPLFVAGGGLVLAGVGGVLWLGANAEVNEAAEGCLDPVRRSGCSDAAKKAGNAARADLNTYGAITLTGVGVFAGGLIWYFVQPGGEENAQLSPAVAPGFAGLSYSGSF